MNRFKSKKTDDNDEDEQIDEELDLICVYPEDDNQLIDPIVTTELKEEKVVKGVKFQEDVDNISLLTTKSNHNFDDFGLETSDVVSLDKFKDDEFQNELGRSIEFFFCNSLKFLNSKNKKTK